MTDQFSGRPRRRRAGRHRGVGRPQPPQRASEQEARQNRQAIFGETKRTWLAAHASDAETAQPDTPEPQDPTPHADAADDAAHVDTTGTAATQRFSPVDDGTEDPYPSASTDENSASLTASTDEQHPSSPTPATAEAPDEPHPDDSTAPDPGLEPTAVAPRRGRRRRILPEEETDAAASAWGPHTEAAPAGAEPGHNLDATTEADATSEPSAPQNTPPADSTTSDDPARTTPQRSAQRREHSPGSGLPKVALWTLLTSALPGTGLITTRLRRVGLILLGLLIVAVLAAAGFYLFTDPVRTGLRLLSRRGVLWALLALVVGTGIVWCLQIVATTLAQATKERLRGGKRVAALVLAAVMVGVVALPFGRGIQSLWAAQSLLGSQYVFGGKHGEGRVVDGPDPWAGVGRVNIMMLGQDAGADRTGTRPDTIMVASIDTETGRTALFSIPRNLEHVRFPKGTVAAKEFPDGFRYFGRNQDLINAVWTWAEDRKDLFPGDPEPGLTATRWAVEETLGLKTDYYAMVNLQGFEDLVDAIGGVNMVVERRIPIGGGINQATGRKNKVTGYIEPGEQKLDGYHALWYARSREGSDDFNRMCRQQRIVRVVTEEANPQTLALSIPGLVSATEKNIVTDIPTTDVDAFVELALRIKDAGFTSYPITQDVTPSGDPDWEYVKAWTQASIEDSMQQEAPESVTGAAESTSASGAPQSEKAATSPEASEDSESATESETPTASETPSESATDDDDSTSGSEKPTTQPTVEKDPLQSCMPGYDEDAEG